MTSCTCGIDGFDHSATCAYEVERIRRLLKPPITVVSVILWRNDNVLLGQRRNTGIWCSPGGKADHLGPLRDQAAREMFEETGIGCHTADLTPYPAFDEHISETGQVYTCVYYVLERVLMPVPWLREPDKFTEWRWFPAWELPSLMFDGDRDVITRLRHDKRF